ncbi:hypothetical protein [Actinobacillus capsulatus]|uniref:hypothetical protein n=1 Tax=Actinobacillus capsulatus TaxID=717 RepID=UPI00036F2F6B|nr:hypothetical protein [Actinobacillus capsulatus]
MSFNIQTNHLASNEQQALIADELGCVPNQSTQSILIAFEHKPMWYRGNRPAAWVVFRVFANENHIGYGELTAQISRILHRTLNIELARIFVEFADIAAFGIGGRYVER